MPRRMTIMEVKGDPDALLAASEKLDEATISMAVEYGGISHAVARTPEGILIVNLWESEEGSDQMALDPRLREATEASGVIPVASGPPNITHYELVRLVTAGDLQA